MAGNRVWLEVAKNAVVVKKQFVAPTIDATGSPQTAIQRHKAQAHWLRAAQHLPVVDLVDIDASSLTLTTQFASGRSLAHPALTKLQLTTALVQACDAVQQLHDHGLIHGALSAAHILVAPESVWLCGATGLPSEPSIDASGFSAILQELAWLQSCACDPKPGSRNQRPSRQLKRRQQYWDEIAATAHQSFYNQLPTATQLSQLLGLAS